jgi:hypothetical protein
MTATAKTTFACAEVPGATRQSARPYSHCIIGRRDGATSAATQRARVIADAAQTKRWDTKHWHDAKRAAEATPGQLYKNSNGYMVEASQAVVDIYAKFMAQHPTLDGYLAHQAQQTEEYLQALQAEPTSELAVLQWSMSHKNAMKALGGFTAHHIDLRIVPTVVLHTTKPRAKAVA